MSALTQNQCQELAERLHARRDELLEDIMVRIREEEDDLAAQLDVQLSELDDYAVADELVGLNRDYIEAETEKLRGVQNAEARMRSGTYGVCIDCHKDINPDRLQLQPSASRCAECDAKHQRSLGVSDHGYH